jgi:hypothetical protein
MLPERSQHDTEVLARQVLAQIGTAHGGAEHFPARFDGQHAWAPSPTGRLRAAGAMGQGRAGGFSCHCEERSDAAISIRVRNAMGIASLRSQ